MPRLERPELNDLGRAIINAPEIVTANQKTIATSESTIDALLAMSRGFDFDKLSRGEFTGDQRLDAALCMIGLYSPYRKDKKWLRTTEVIYGMLCDLDQRLQDFKQGPILFDDTSSFDSPYGGNLVFGSTERPELQLEFNGKVSRINEAVDMDRSIRIKISNYSHVAQVQNYGLEADVSEKALDITHLFHPNGFSGRYNIVRIVDEWKVPEFIQKAGIFLGEEEIDKHVKDVTDYLGSGYWLSRKDDNTEFIEDMELAKNEVFAKARQLTFKSPVKSSNR